MAALSVALAVTTIAASSEPVESTGKLPILRASSRTVDIVDGARTLRGIWTIAPDVPLDVYYARRAPGSRKVTFVSDVESLTFEVANGRDYDFMINLDGKLCCRTRISTARVMPGIAGVIPTAIPFTIGSDGKIHVVGRINDSEPLDLLVDLGADSVVLFPSGVDKRAQLRLDGESRMPGRVVRLRAASADATGFP
jgi:hypothetical protein